MGCYHAKRHQAMRDRREMSEPLWSIGQVSEFLGVPPATLHRWIGVGYGPRSFRIGRHRKWKAEEVRAWVEEQADGPAASA